jgi:hypothetical protein
LKKSLFSIPVARRSGVISFEDDDVFLKTGKANFRLGGFKNGLFYLHYRFPSKGRAEHHPKREEEMQAMTTAQEQGRPTTAEVLHRRCGHISQHTVKDIMKQVDGVLLEETKDGDEFFCEDCAIGKASRQSFPTNHRRCTDILGKIHADLKGPIEASGIHGERYVMLLTDEASNVTSYMFLKKKNEAFEHFVMFKKEMERQYVVYYE